MSSIQFLALWGLFVLIVCTASLIAMYRKWHLFHTRMSLQLQQVESDLLEDFNQVDLTELEQTQAGRELLMLLMQEYPHLLKKRVSAETIPSDEVKTKKNIHALAINYLLKNIPNIQEWPEMRRVLNNAAEKKDYRWQLPYAACDAVGGSLEEAIPAIAAIGCMQICISLTEDLLDSNPYGEHHRIGVAATSNLAAGFQAAGFQAIAHDGILGEAKLAALDSLSHMILTTSLGQEASLQNPTDEADYWRMVQTKKAPFFSAAFEVGALAGGASVQVALQFRQLGLLYGEIVHLNKDIYDSLAVPASSEWSSGEVLFPILYAESVDYPERERFRELRKIIPDPDALTEAQSILIRAGAISYSLEQLFIYSQKSQGILREMLLKHYSGLQALFDHQIRPGHELFLSTYGVSHHEYSPHPD